MGLERLVVPIEWKAADDDQTLEGYASTFGNVDLGGDVVVKGAFKKTIANIKANGIPLLADHIPSTASVLGTIFDAEERAKGLWIKARLSKAPSAQDTRTKLLEGHLNKMSIGYETMDHAFEDRDGQRVRMLKELKLWESSVVVIPMNPEAAIARVKSVVDTLDAADRKSLMDEIANTESTKTTTDQYRHEVEAKATTNEIREQLSATLRSDLPATGNRWRWVRDFDTSHVWYEDDPDGAIYEQTYTVTDAGAVTLTGQPIKVRAVTTYIPVDESGKNAATDEVEDKAAPTANVTDEVAPPPDEGVSGWDRWASEAVLAGRDPKATAEPGKRAGLAKSLELMEEYLKQHDAPTDPIVRAGNAKRLELLEDDLRKSGTATPATARTDLASRLASLESPSGAESVPSR